MVDGPTEQSNTGHGETEDSVGMEHSPAHQSGNEGMDTGEHEREDHDGEEEEVQAEQMQPVVPMPPPPHRLGHRRFRQPFE